MEPNPPERHPLVPTTLQASVDHFAKDVRGFAAEVRDLKEEIKRQKWWMRFASLMLVALMCQVGFDTYQQVQRNQQARVNARILRTIEDATTPGHPIYERSQANTAAAVHALLMCGRAYADNASRGMPIPADCP